MRPTAVAISCDASKSKFRMTVVRQPLLVLEGARIQKTHSTRGISTYRDGRKWKQTQDKYTRSPRALSLDWCLVTAGEMEH